MGEVVDTSVLIEIERTVAAIGLERLSDGATIAAITLAELLEGVLLANSERRQRARQMFANLVQNRLPIVSFGIAEAEAHAALYVQLRRAGTMIGERDLQIAATALAHGHSVLTRNVREFAQVAGLTVSEPGW